MSLNAEYFTLNSGYTGLADVDFDAEPSATSTVDALDIQRMRGAFWEGGAKNYFAARYFGDLNVIEAGRYTFYLKSDSNAMLYINGELVAENAGGRGGRNSEITLDLDAGAHDIEIRYFDGRGRSTLQLDWKGPDSDGKRETITGDALSKGEKPVDGDQTGDDSGDNGDTDSGDQGTGDDTGDQDAGDDTDTDAGDQDAGDDADTGDQGAGDDTDTDAGDQGAGDDTGTDTGDQGAGDDADTDNGDHDTGDDGHTGDGDQDTDTGTQTGRQGLRGEYFILPDFISNLNEVDFDATPDGEGSVESLSFMGGQDPFWEGGPNDLFAARYAGQLNVQEAGTYTIYLTSDDGSVLYIDGEPVIDNDGLHGTLEQRVSLDLSAGVHDIEIRYFEAYGEATLQLEWVGPDSDGQREVIGGEALGYPESTSDDGDSDSGDHGAGDDDDADSGDQDAGDDDHTGDGDHSTGDDDSDSSDGTGAGRQGLLGQYFLLSKSVGSIQEIDFEATPYGTGAVENLSFMNGQEPFWEGGPGDLFAVRYTGNLNVQKAGTYTFYLNSDDGSALYINGEPVIDNDGLHATLEQRVTLDLPAGSHDIEIRYFEAYGDATLQLEWAGPDSDGRREVIGGDSLSYSESTSDDDGHTGGDHGTDDGDQTGGDDDQSSGDDGHTGGDHGTDDGDQTGGDDDQSSGDDGHTGGDHGTDDGDQTGGDDDQSSGDDGHTGGDHGTDDGDQTGGDDDQSSGDDGHTGGGSHGGHSDGYIPPPTSPDEVDDYVAAVMAQPDAHPHGGDESLAVEHAAVLDLVPRSEATHVAISDGDWFDPNTWHEGRIPDAGAQVLIPEGVSVVYAGESDESLFTVRVDGELSFAHDSNSKILVDTMIVSGTGRLEIGTEENPIADDVDVEIVIANNGDIDVGWDPMLFSRGVISHGQVEIHGAEKTSFLTVDDAPMAGDTEITLSDIPEGWQVGDTIVLTGTHKEGWYWDQAAGSVIHHESEDEEVVVTGISGNTITIDRPLEHDHDAPRDDLSAYVANTSRNITFSSEDGEDTAVHHRGHTMFMHSDDVDVRYAAFDDLGRTDKSEPAFDVTSLDSVQADSNIKTRYPFHFHRTGTEDRDDPAIAIGNSVSGSPGWGFVHHDSNATFTDNVAWDIFGAAFVAENGNETGVWSHNIAIRTEGVSYGESQVKLQSDVERHDNGRTGEGFFFAGRLVEASDNVAANTTHGFVWMTRGQPSDPLSENLDQPEIAYGDEYMRLDQAPIQGFENNEAFGTEVGLIVIKDNPNQNHDVRSVMDGFTNWETTRGVDISYTSHYTLIDFDLLATQQPGQYPEIGFRLGGNAFDIVSNGMTIDGFVTGAHLDQAFHFGSNGEDYDDVFIDLVLANNGTNIVGFNGDRHSILNSDDLVEGRLGFVLESDTVISEGETFYLSGTKTDSIGSRDRDFAGDQQILWWHDDIAKFIANEGYYKTESGENVLLLEDFVADRATGELHKMTHVITLDMTDQQIANSWSINHWGGAQYNGVVSFDNVNPTAQDDSASTNAGMAVLIDVLSNDSHAGGDDLRVDGLSTTPNGNVYVQDDGQLLYVPNPDFVGVDTFDYWAGDDDGDFTRATVTVEVFDM